MKKITTIMSFLVFILIACQSPVVNENGEVKDSLSAPVNEAYAFRDMSITPENSYSDLFLDTAAVERYLQKEKVDAGMAKQIRHFYNYRNFQYAWFSTSGLTEQGRSFWYLYDYKRKDTEDSLSKRMDTLAMEDSLMLNPSDSSLFHLELELTRQYISYKQENKEAGLAFSQHPVPVKKIDIMQWADSILNKQKDSSLFQNNKSYSLLRQHLARYYMAAQNGGWEKITLKSSLKKGITSPAISKIKKRLFSTNDYSNDTTAVFNDSLEMAIKSYQARNGFKPTGIITDSLVKNWNVPLNDRMEKILINLNRMAWTPAKTSNYITVNIPAFMLNVYEDSGQVFNMNVIVGKEGTSTMMFTGDLNQIVFSPYWNVPRSIVVNEIMPAMKKDPNYLKKKNMEIVKGNDSVPRIRQLPGGDNSLGMVKFLFPNSFDIYFHDTPEKGLFDKNKRAFSHGCIRLADANKMAQYLLQDQKEWTPEKIGEAMNSGKEQSVKLSRAVPVFITYYTAWVDDSGQLQFRDDIYKYDSKTAKMLFNGSQLPPDQNPRNNMKKDSSKKKIM